MSRVFVTDYASIVSAIHKIKPELYGKTRNYIDGAVTYLSPYIARGVISTKQVLVHIIQCGYSLRQIESLVKELSWRDYFQRVAQHKSMSTDIKQAQTPVTHYGIPNAVLNAYTGIVGIDVAIQNLYNIGYMHNHCRMYTAALVCNVAQSYWRNPSQWMYYHLLDGDFASNTCSWQWVAGANSSKKYYANQENINKYTYTQQVNTYLDRSYEDLAIMPIPTELQETSIFQAELYLPQSDVIAIDTALPTFIFNYYNLDPLWHAGEAGNFILLIEPDCLATYPISKKCMDFMLALSKNIPHIQVYVGAFDALVEKWQIKHIFYKEHPLNAHYTGVEEPRDWIVHEVTGYFPSFFAYWKAIEKYIAKQFALHEATS